MKMAITCRDAIVMCTLKVQTIMLQPVWFNLEPLGRGKGGSKVCPVWTKQALISPNHALTMC